MVGQVHHREDRVAAPVTCLEHANLVVDRRRLAAVVSSRREPAWNLLLQAGGYREFDLPQGGRPAAVAGGHGGACDLIVQPVHVVLVDSRVQREVSARVRWRAVDPYRVGRALVVVRAHHHLVDVAATYLVGNLPGQGLRLCTRLGDVVLEDPLGDHRDQRDGLAVVARNGDGAGVDRVVQELRSLVDSTREVDAFPAAVVVVVAERLGCAAWGVEVAGTVGVLVGLLEPPQARPGVDGPRAGDPTGGVDLGKVLEILRGGEGGRGGIDLRRPDAPGGVRPGGRRHRGDEKHRHDEPYGPPDVHLPPAAYHSAASA